MTGACGEAPAESRPGGGGNETGPATTTTTTVTVADGALAAEPPSSTTSSSTAASTVPSTSTTAVPATTGATLPQLDTGDISGFEIVSAHLGDRSLRLALADTPVLRNRGLMGVTSLGDLDGMLFAWDSAVQVSFWMKDTLIPLDIGFFDESGALFLVVSMAPCQADPCPRYPSEAPIRYALEALPGFFDNVASGEALVPRKNTVTP